MRLLSVASLAFAALLPAAAFAGCSTAELRICVLDSPGPDGHIERPCSVEHCVTADAVFDYFALGDSHYVSVDAVSDGVGRMNADLGPGADGDDAFYQDFAVQTQGDYSYAVDGRPYFWTLPCDDRCAGLDGTALLD